MAEKFEETSQRLKFREIIFNNFVGGLSWALGATVGLGIIVTILGIISKNINLVPVVGSFVSKVIDFILATNSNLHK